MNEPPLDDLWRRLPQPEFGQAVELLRATFRLSRDDLASRICRVAPRPVGVDAATIYRWGAGKQAARPSYRPLLARVTERELSLMTPESRRDFLRRLGVLAGVSVAVSDPEPWERLSAALRAPSRLDPKTIEHLEAVTFELARREREVQDPVALLGAVEGHLGTLTSFLQASVGNDARRRLAALAADTTGVAGWLVWDVGGPDAAARYFRSGLLAAREGGDDPMAAYLLGSLAFQPMYMENPERRLRALEGIGHATPHTRAWLASMEASAHALAGRGTDYDRAIERAANLVERPPGLERPPALFFDPDYLHETEAAALATLGRASEAQRVVEAALPQARGRFRPWLLLDLAYAHAAAGRVDEAADAARRTIETAEATNMRTVLTSIPDLLGKLKRLDGAAVQALGEFFETRT